MQYRPSVFLFADPDPLSLSILEKLLGHLCFVKIISLRKDDWKERTSHISQSNFFEIATSSEGQSCEYIIFSDPELLIKDFYYKEFLNLYKKFKPKTLVVLTYATDSEETERKLNKNRGLIAPYSEEIGTIFVGDLLGPRIDLSYLSLMRNVLSEAKAKKRFSLSKSPLSFYPLEYADAAREIAKFLFSFGPYGESIALLGAEISQEEFFQRLRKYLPQVNMSYSSNIVRQIAFCESKTIIQKPLDNLLRESLSWLKDERKASNLPVEKKLSLTFNKKERPTTLKKLWLRISLSFFILLFLPYLCLFVSSASFVFLGYELKKANFSAVRTILPFGKGISKTTTGILDLYAEAPFIGGVFLAGRNLSVLNGRAINLIDSGVGLLDDISSFVSLSLGDEVYDVGKFSEQIGVELDWIYKEAGFLEGEISGLAGTSGRIIRKYFPTSETADTREKLLQFKTLVSEAPSLLGGNKPTTYLILFQNNMELRPTGGFIGSFALLTFDGGRLTDISVSDVYSADGQLKGHVEPPAAIRDHLGEANWYLRDSNWDPDFSVSGSRAEWFLGKELDKSVDGVVGIDLELVKELLKVLGPVSLSDFNEVIDESNLYEKTQSQVEENFFAGSYQKTNFLTALSRELIMQLTESGQDKYLPIGKAIWKSLEERHVQVFSHNRRVQNSLAFLGFDGAVNQPVCTGNCFSDWLGMAEANVGVNKANYFLKRSASLSIYLSAGSLKRFLTIKLENSANPALEEAGRYKTYLRVMLPAISEVNDVEVSSGSEKYSLTPIVDQLRGRKEAGILVEVLPKETKEILFSWEEPIEINFNEPGEFRFYWRKQAGTASDPISVSVNLPETVSPTFTPLFSLTSNGSFSYNTVLTRDLFSRIIW